MDNAQQKLQKGPLNLSDPLEIFHLVKDPPCTRVLSSMYLVWSGQQRVSVKPEKIRDPSKRIGPEYAWHHPRAGLGSWLCSKELRQQNPQPLGSLDFLGFALTQLACLTFFPFSSVLTYLHSLISLSSNSKFCFPHQADTVDNLPGIFPVLLWAFIALYQHSLYNFYVVLTQFLQQTLYDKLNVLPHQ